MISLSEIFPYTPVEPFQKRVAYFSMEFAVDQALKIYSGGLGFLAGSHLRSAFDLKQNVLGVGILWSYGYYDQQIGEDGEMGVRYLPKNYSFLIDTGVKFQIPIHGSPVWVKAFFLKPETFGSAPLFLLSTDIEENDSLSRTITHRLYDPIEATRIAQSIILGTAGAMLLDILGLNPEVYHMNEGHSVSLNFYLLEKFKTLEEVQKRVVFTTHTPELAGNEEHRFSLLAEMSFFHHFQDHEIKKILDLSGDQFNYTLAALRFARKANGVSKIHGEVAREMWTSYSGICPIISITNAQNKRYWKDSVYDLALVNNEDSNLIQRKLDMKKELFRKVLNETGKKMDPEVLTLVWARRFAGYKRADLLISHWEEFCNIIHNQEQPLQILWAGKPYPEDFGAIAVFNQILRKIKPFSNCAILTGYELELSALLKRGSDLWLNNPRMYREASGTSGMTAAMNGSLNLSIPDGWIPEFAIDLHNAFILPKAPDTLGQEDRDHLEGQSLLSLLKDKIIPLYYEKPQHWLGMVKNAAREIVPEFDSDRMVKEYYEKLY